MDRSPLKRSKELLVFERKKKRRERGREEEDVARIGLIQHPIGPVLAERPVGQSWAD